MATQKKSKLKKRPPATTPEARENQLISLAVNLAEEQLIDGTASSQVITHYLKLGTTREHLEKEVLAEKRDQLRAKTESLASGKDAQELYSNAVDAMRAYSGSDGEVSND